MNKRNLYNFLLTGSFSEDLSMDDGGISSMDMAAEQHLRRICASRMYLHDGAEAQYSRQGQKQVMQ